MALAKLNLKWQSDWGIRISPEIASELLFWQQAKRDAFSSPVWAVPVADYVPLHTDAGDHSWGGVLGQRIAQGFFTQAEKETSSTQRELLAVLYSLRSFASFLHGRSAKLHVDNKAAHYIIRQGSMKPHLHELALRINETAIAARLQLECIWVPREENVEADAVTHLADPGDWAINPHVFEALSRQFGPFTIDRFASHLNHVLPVFNSLNWCPGTAGVDALQQSDWSHYCNWVNPPFSAMGQVIRKIVECKCTGVLICPLWPTRPWWPLLCGKPTHFRGFITDAVLLPDSPELFTFKAGRGETVAGTVAPSWAVMALKFDSASTSRIGARIPRCVPLSM
jgi:hypothetical protein